MMEKINIGQEFRGLFLLKLFISGARMKGDLFLVPKEPFVSSKN